MHELMHDPQTRRTTAYHEAAHAAMHFMFGKYVERIDMTGGPNNALAGVQGEGGTWTSPMLIRAHVESGDGRDAKVEAMMGLIQLLAGPYIDHKLEPAIYDEGFDPIWLSERVEIHYTLPDESHPDEIDEGCDVVRAVRIAFAAYGEDSPRSWGFLRRAGKWTEQLVEESRVWRVIEALGERLIVADWMSGGEADDLMASAWGKRTGFGLRDLPWKWRRRFPLPWLRTRRAVGAG